VSGLNDVICFSEKHLQISTHVVTGKLRLVIDEEVLPEGRGAGLRQRVDVPVVQEVVGLGEWTKGEIKKKIGNVNI
jgi:hypothetical protein